MIFNMVLFNDIEIGIQYWYWPMMTIDPLMIIEMIIDKY